LLAIVWQRSSRGIMTYGHHSATAAFAVVMMVLTLIGLHCRASAAATLEEVAYCRGIEQTKDRVRCFKLLKLGRHPKLNSDAGADVETNAAKPQVATQPLNGDTSRLQTVPPTSVKEQTTAKRQTDPSAITQALPAGSNGAGDDAATGSGLVRNLAAPATSDTTPTAQPEKDGVSRQREGSQPELPAAAHEETAPDGQKSISQTNAPRSRSLTDEPDATGSIDRIDPTGRPLCVDQDALVAMLSAGLLTSDLRKAATEGCQAVPGDAKLTRLEGYPSAFVMLRIVRVNVASPSHPELTTGFTIETSR
jgi:hypothetical protein